MICEDVETTLDGRMRKMAQFRMVGDPTVIPVSNAASQAVKKLGIGSLGERMKV